MRNPLTWWWYVPLPLMLSALAYTGVLTLIYRLQNGPDRLEMFLGRHPGLMTGGGLLFCAIIMIGTIVTVRRHLANNPQGHMEWPAAFVIFAVALSAIMTWQVIL
jgi:hypothetical protein